MLRRRFHCTFEYSGIYLELDLEPTGSAKVQLSSDRLSQAHRSFGRLLWPFGRVRLFGAVWGCLAIHPSIESVGQRVTE